MAVDQINPNLFLRNHVTRWRERQNHVSYSHGPSAQVASQKLEQDSDITSKQSSESTPDHLDEYDIAVLPTHSEHFASAAGVKTAPIVIKMQPHGRSQSPPPATSTRSMDKTPEDDKESDSEHGTLRSVRFDRSTLLHRSKLSVKPTMRRQIMVSEENQQIQKLRNSHRSCSLNVSSALSIRSSSTHLRFSPSRRTARQ